MREPPITITCDCGTGASLAYGERWTCPTCGKICMLHDALCTRCGTELEFPDEIGMNPPATVA